MFCLVDSYPEFGFSEEAGALQDLLKAYDDGDDDAVRTTLSLPLFKYMDNAVSEYMFLIRDGHGTTMKCFVKFLKQIILLCLVALI